MICCIHELTWYDAYVEVIWRSLWWYKMMVTRGYDDVVWWHDMITLDDNMIWQHDVMMWHEMLKSFCSEQVEIHPVMWQNGRWEQQKHHHHNIIITIISPSPLYHHHIHHKRLIIKILNQKWDFSSQVRHGTVVGEESISLEEGRRFDDNLMKMIIMMMMVILMMMIITVTIFQDHSKLFWFSDAVCYRSPLGHPQLVPLEIIIIINIIWLNATKIIKIMTQKYSLTIIL